MRFALSLVLFASATPAFAVDSSAGPSPTPSFATAKSSEAKDLEDRKICKRVASTESRLGAKKLCMTAAQWKEYNETNG